MASFPTPSIKRDGLNIKSWQSQYKRIDSRVFAWRSKKSVFDFIDNPSFLFNFEHGSTMAKPKDEVFLPSIFLLRVSLDSAESRRPIGACIQLGYSIRSVWLFAYFWQCLPHCHNRTYQQIIPSNYYFVQQHFSRHDHSQSFIFTMEKFYYNLLVKYETNSVLFNLNQS